MKQRLPGFNKPRQGIHHSSCFGGWGGGEEGWEMWEGVEKDGVDSDVQGAGLALGASPLQTLPIFYKVNWHCHQVNNIISHQCWTLYGLPEQSRVPLLVIVSMESDLEESQLLLQKYNYIQVYALCTITRIRLYNLNSLQTDDFICTKTGQLFSDYRLATPRVKL